LLSRYLSLTDPSVRRLLTLLFLSASLVASPALAEGWEALRTTVAVSYGRDQGLPHPVVMAMAQDSEGIMWIGTQGGLARFDGYRFRTYLHRDGDPTSLPGDVISAVLLDAAGRLWVGTLTGEVAWYDPAIDGFRAVAQSVEQPRGGVNALARDGADGLWVACNTGLEHVDAQGAVVRYHHRDGDPASLPSDRVRTVRVTQDGTVWAATYRGLARKRPDSESFEAIPLVGLAGGRIDDVVISLEEAGDGHLWFATFQSQVGRMADDRPVAVTLYDISQAYQGGPSAYGMIEGRPGELWIARISGGITRLDMASGELRQIRHEPGIAVSLADNAVRSLFKGHAGLIWAGTNHGFSIVNPDSRVVDNVLPSEVSGQLSDPNVLSLAAFGDRAWLGYKDQGVAKLDPAAGRITRLTDAVSLPPGSTTAMAVEPDGSLWIAAGTGRALYRMEARTGKLDPVPFPHDDTSVLISLLWQNGTLWAGAGPLMRLDPATGVWQTFHHSADPDSLGDDSANVMLPDGKGGLWIGTRRGLDHLDLASGKFTHSVHDPADPKSIPGNFVASLLIDRRGRLWVSTLSNGIAMVEPGPDGAPLRFRRIGTAEGLPNSIVDALQEDGRGRIWASTDMGLAVIDPDSFTVLSLGRDEGVAISAHWTNSSAKLADGTLLFGGAEGLTVVHPDRLSHKVMIPPVVVTDIRIGQRAVPPAIGKEPLVLGPRDRSLEVEFAALDYSAPDKLRYAYQLEGFDEGWIALDGARRLASYTNLPPGHYRLHLRASDRDGAWLPPVTLAVTVEPAWWQSWWFRMIAVLLAATAIFGLVQLRTRFLQKRRQLLERLVASQTRDLIEANKQLQHLASRDSLTGIYNRRHFLELAGAEMERSRRSGRQAALVLIDVDHFKRVNDTYGHSAGDEVLRGVVACIKALLRDSDLFARVGGEELVVLMPETGMDAAHTVAERLRLAVETAAIPVSGASVAVTASFGLAVTQQPPEPMAELMERADRALYSAKAAGRNRVEIAA